MREVDLVRRIAEMAAGSATEHLTKGIGDDCAILRPPVDADLVAEGAKLALERRGAGPVRGDAGRGAMEVRGGVVRREVLPAVARESLV